MKLQSLFLIPLIATGCSSLPKDAPKEYVNAQKKIEAANEADVSEYFPKTIARAETSFKDARSKLNKSDREKTGDFQTRSYYRKAGIKQADEAGRMATKAMILTQRVRQWDNDISTQSEDPENEMQRLRQDLQSLNENPTLDINFSGPVAFFDTNEVELDERYVQQLEDLKKLMKENKNLQVTLVGYADPRGNYDHNQVLAQRRAEEVARRLRAAGIASDRIIIESKVTDVVTRDVADKAARTGRMQLERRVEAQVTTL